VRQEEGKTEGKDKVARILEDRELNRKGAKKKKKKKKVIW
jgi:hypothetical protein